MATSTIKKDAPIIIKKQYSGTFGFSASERKGITATNLNMSTPSGYEVLGVYNAYTTSADVDVIGIRASSTGTQNALWVRNRTNSTVRDVTVYFYVAYIRSDLT